MKKPENISSCKNLYPYRRWSLYGPITNIYTVYRKVFVNRDIQHLYCLSSDIIDLCIVQRSIPPGPQYSMLPINLNFIQNQKSYKKNIHVTIYIHVIHVRSDIALMEGDLYPLWFLKNIIWMHLASKNRLYFLQKNCLSTKPTNIYTAQWSINLNFIQNFKIAKKCIHDMLMLLTHV